MVNNFDLIRNLLTFASDDEFYFVQILQRKKDNPGNVNGSNNSSRLIKAYYIDSLEKFDNLKDEMIFFAEHFNARVGINLNKRSYYKTAFNVMKKMAEQMHNKQFRNVRKTYNTCCGIHNGGDKIWLLDVDQKLSDKELNDFRLELGGYQPLGDKVLAYIPSKNGVHVITRGFDLTEFRMNHPDIEVHKNNPTNLYIP